MKKYHVLLAASLVAQGLFAQNPAERDTIQMEINGSTITIETDDLNKVSSMDLNAMVREVNRKTAEMQGKLERSLAAIEEDRAAGNITEEDATRRREEAYATFEAEMDAFSKSMEAWGEAYSQRMDSWGEKRNSDWEAWGEAYGASWERWAEQWEAEAERMEEENRGGMPKMPPVPPMPPFRDGEGDNYNYRSDDQEWRSGHNNTSFIFDIHLGINNLYQDGALATGNWSLSTWNSFDFNFTFGGKTRLGQPGTKFYVKYGLGFDRHNLRLKGTNIVEKSADFTDAIADTTRNIAQSTLGVWYMTAPLMLEFDASRHGRDNSFTLGVGGYAGLRIHSWRRVEFDDAGNDRAREYTYNNWFMNPFHYGLMGQVGFGAFKITAKYDLNGLFQAGKGPDLNLATISIGFTI